MTYAADIDELLVVLSRRAAGVARLSAGRRTVRHGLVSVGLKLHCVGPHSKLEDLIDGLGGRARTVERNIFKQSNADYCLVLPPVGSADAAVTLLECIEAYTSEQIFGNPTIQLQVCSPGRLSQRSAALLGIGFYLGSDTLRQYKLQDFATTVSTRSYHRGKRLVLYDAGSFGEFDAEFEWWVRTAGRVDIRRSLPFLNGRTDLLVGPASKTDLQNINLLATLLLHAECPDAYWQSTGRTLARDLEGILNRHLLSGVLDADWVCSAEFDANPAADDAFILALQEVTAYAAAEADRLSRWSPSLGTLDEFGGILFEMHELLQKYRGIVRTANLRRLEDHDD